MAANSTSQKKSTGTKSASTSSRSSSTRSSTTRSTASQSKRGASSNSGAANRTYNSQGTKRTNKYQQEQLKRKNEIRLFIILAITIFLLLSNFGLCGVVGNVFAKFIFGLFGSVAYVLPIYCFVSAGFLLSNGTRRFIVKRVLCVGIFLIAIAFVCQLVKGAGHQSVKALYDIGANSKRGGGVILGGILVLLYKLIGFPGSIIVTVLLTIIGIITVLDTSVIEWLKNLVQALRLPPEDEDDYDDDDYEDDDYEDDDYDDELEDEYLYEEKPKKKEPSILETIKVLPSEENQNKAKNKKKKKKARKIDEEEVHELKAIPHEDVLKQHNNQDIDEINGKNYLHESTDMKLNLNFSGGFETKTEGTVSETKRKNPLPKPVARPVVEQPVFVDNGIESYNQIHENDFMQEAKEESSDVSYFNDNSTFENEFSSGQDLMNSMLENQEEPEKRTRKRTKESYQEMIEERDAISSSINHSNSGMASANARSNDDISADDISTVEIPADEYRLPPLDLLRSSGGNKKSGVDNSIIETAEKLRSTLASFGVNVSISNYSQGPSVTRYELLPEQGVKVSKVVNLADDIKLNLAAADIRIEAPIPGKPAIGIEVPNKESQPVFFRDLLESENFQNNSSNIAFAVGKDIGGQVVVHDIAKMPHLLVAGATGSGKSVCINTLIMSILYKANPNDVKLMMIDPKQVELSVYNGIPHMLVPVVTDPKKAAGALNWAVMEMSERYSTFSKYNVRNIQGFNEKVEKFKDKEDVDDDIKKKMPQIIIIVDELADLMMVAHGEVEDAIVRLSQLARAAGIHLVIATQRPSVDVITGLIKANVPSRIAMTVSSGVDSRTILDMNGAEKLLGKGDMLFYPTGYPKPVRVQGAFLSDDEILEVCNFLREQNGEAVVDEKVAQGISNSSAGSGGPVGNADLDEYFVDAGKFIIGKDKASIGLLQRVFKIGFNRAARIMDQLEEANVVGPEEGTKPRKVLMSLEEFENYVEEHL